MKNWNNNIDKFLNLLTQEYYNEDESLLILLLRAVVLGHTLLLYRKYTQI